MKSLFLFAALLLFCAGAVAQTAPPSSDPDSRALIEKSKSLLEAMKNKDPQALNALLDANFRGVNLAGGLSSRGEMLGAAHEGFINDFLFYNPQAFRVDNDSVLVSYDSVVTLSDQAIQELAQDNITWPRYSRASDLWVREGGDWKLKFEQITPVLAMY